ncbi:hypothetical protein, partial [Pseudomonas viridiflava]|uniref:hypothetical protein n=1 Tax=Pseudomonas viridiflava TaxID=33069 RepID=UPI0019D29B1B
MAFALKINDRSLRQLLRNRLAGDLRAPAGRIRQAFGRMCLPLLLAQTYALLHSPSLAEDAVHDVIRSFSSRTQRRHGKAARGAGGD